MIGTVGAATFAALNLFICSVLGMLAGRLIAWPLREKWNLRSVLVDAGVAPISVLAVVSAMNWVQQDVPFEPPLSILFATAIASVVALHLFARGFSR